MMAAGPSGGFVPPAPAAGEQRTEPRLRRHASLPLWLACLLLALTALGLVSAAVVTSRGLAVVGRLAATRLDLERLLSELKDVETGQRGFLATGNPSFLELYDDAPPRIAARLDRVVAELAKAHPAVPTETIVRLTREKLAFTGATVDMARGGHLEVARAAVAEGEGKRVMDAIRAEARRFGTIIDSRRAEVERQTRLHAIRATAASLLGAVLASFLVGVMAFLQRRQSAEWLRLSEQSRALALDAAGLGTWEWDVRNGRLTTCRFVRRLFEFPPDVALRASDLLDSISDKDQKSAGEALRNAVRQDGCDWQGWVGRGAAPARLVHVQAGLYRDHAGQPTVLRGVAQDITARHAAEERMRGTQMELLHATRVSAVGETASATAHELSQPLSAAATFLHACEQMLRSGQEYDRDDLLAGLSRGLDAVGFERRGGGRIA